eukprot:1660411-Rhodomonas_salina.4
MVLRNGFVLPGTQIAYGGTQCNRCGSRDCRAEAVPRSVRLLDLHSNTRIDLPTRICIPPPVPHP